MSSIKVTQIAPRHLRGTTFIGQDGSTTHFHPHSRVILHEYATKEWILEMLGELEGADLSELVTKKYAHATFGEIFLGKTEPLGVKVTDIWFDTTKEDQHLKMCSQLDRDPDGNVIKQHWIHVAPRPSVDDDVQRLKEDVVALEGEIEALITLDEKGAWESTLTDDGESGTVYFSTPDFTSKEITVKISKTDTDSNAHMFSTVTFGTWIEFIEDDSDYCLGQVALLDNEDDDFFEATLNVSVGKGLVHDESNVRIRAFEATEFDPASIRIVDIDDKPPVEPNEGNLWFDNNPTDMTLRVFHEASDAWLAVAPATTIEGRVTSGEAKQVAIQSTIDQSLVEQARIKASPPGVSFLYQSGSTGLTATHFQVWGGNGSDGRIRLHAQGQYIDWLYDGFTADYTMDNGPYFTIWYLDMVGRPRWKMRNHGRVRRIDWHTNDAYVYMSSQKTNGSLLAGASYNITIGGVM